MALAWKAGWVHALTSSNLVSSATTIPALMRAGIAVSGSVTSLRATFAKLSDALVTHDILAPCDERVYARRFHAP